MNFNENHSAVKNLPAAARRDWAVAATVGGSEKHGWEYLKKAGWIKNEHKWELKKQDEPIGEKFTAGIRLSKATKEGEDLFVTLVASGFNVDKANEQMEKSAIDTMIETCKMGTVGMRESHNTTFPIAKSVDAYLNNDQDMEVKMKLDKAHPYSSYIFDRVSKGESEEQASVYGFVKSKDYVWNSEKKKMVKSIKDVSLSFIDLTPPTEGCYPASGFVEAIAKQVSWEAEPQAPSPEGPQRGETMEELIKQFVSLVEGVEKSMAPDFKVEAHMLDKSGVLRKDFKAQFDASRKTLTAEQTELLHKSVERLLNITGVETEAAPTVPESETKAALLKKQTVLKKLAESMGVEPALLAKQLGMEYQEEGTAVVVPGLDALQKSIKEQGELLAKLASGTLKGRPAIPGEGVLLEKSATEKKPMTLEELTPLMKSVGESAKGNMLTADGMANARALSNDFVKRVAGAAIVSHAASVGATPSAS